MYWAFEFDIRFLGLAFSSLYKVRYLDMCSVEIGGIMGFVDGPLEVWWS